MKIIVDCMGGDNAPLEVVRGAVAAKKEYGTELLLVGYERDIRAILEEEKADLSGIGIADALETVTMEDDPIAVIKKKPDSSMVIALHLLADGKGDAMVSTGNTGALFTGATLIARRLRGVKRPAIASVLPMQKPVLLLDSGANVVATREYLCQFAVMGSIYMQKNFGIERPRVGLLNNGAEACKGTPLQQETYMALQALPNLNFVGNVEGDRVPFDVCDVLVADGFTGNILLKTMEGMGHLMKGALKEALLSDPFVALPAALIQGKLKKELAKYDSSEYGGAPILGAARPVIKAHGSSDAKAVKNAIRQAAAYASSGTAETIEEELAVFAHPVQTEETEELK